MNDENCKDCGHRVYLHSKYGCGLRACNCKNKLDWNNTQKYGGIDNGK